VIVVARDREEVVVHDRQHVWLIGGLSQAQRDAVVANLERKLAAYGGWDEEGRRLAAGAVREHPGRESGGYEGWRPGTMMAAPLLILVGVVASAAFTVDHRRRMRQAGLLGAVGASSSQVVRIATWEAAGIGVAGAALGAVAGVALAAAAQPAIERLLQRSITGVGLDWVDLAWPAEFGLVAAVVAARRPARSAARVPLVVALRGGPGKPLSAVTLRATAAALLPVALVVVVIAALRDVWSPPPLLTVLGVASLAVGPLIVLLAGHVERWRLLARLAIRSVARHRERTAVVVGGLMVLVGEITNVFLMRYEARPMDGVRLQGMAWLLAGACVGALLLAGVTSVLGAIETDPDICTAVAVGAPPTFRRWFQGAQAGVQVTLATLLGVSGTLLVSLVLDGVDLLPGPTPWPELVLLMLLPGPVVGVLIALLSRSAPSRPVARRIT
jgi:hypothetical protein